MKRKLAIDSRELIVAFEYAEGIQAYLDLETGAIVQISDDAFSDLENLPVDEDDDLETALQNVEDWQQEILREAIPIQEGLGARYLKIPQIDSFEDYRDMADFIATIEDDHRRELLEVAIRGKGAFRRFKDVLYSYPDERERWFAFQEEEMQRRVIHWLNAKNIELDESNNRSG
ncbi:MAG: hypothetical protein F9K27_17615 [Anaerolineae bacterium]|nr:MAG: hypothetical protein F9K27_17615 [Anaerolineae bacterium]